MPDPVWTFQYNFGQTPENNGFTRDNYGATVNTVTGGQTANRRVEITGTSPSVGCAFLTSTIPSLDPNIGVTVEGIMQVTGGQAGLEMTFLNYAVTLDLLPASLQLRAVGDAGTELVEVATPSNSGQTTIRITFSPDRSVRVYRNGTLLGTIPTAPTLTMPFQRVLWWGEGQGTQTFRALRTYLGGAVAPG